MTQNAAPEHFQKFADAYDNGTYHELPNDQAAQTYQQFSQSASPQQFAQVHAQYYDQMPPQQRTAVYQSLLNAFSQRGLDPRQAGVQNTDPNTLSSADAARLTAYAQQQDPNILHQIFGPGGPLGSTGAKIVVAGLAALAAKHFLGGGGGNFDLGGLFGGNTGSGNTVSTGTNSNIGGNSGNGLL